MLMLSPVSCARTEFIAQNFNPAFSTEAQVKALKFRLDSYNAYHVDALSHSMKFEDGLKQRFTEACEAGLPIARIYSKLGLSRSTGYYWYEKWQKFGPNWVDKSAARKRYSYSATPQLRWNHRLIEASSLQHPWMGCDALANYLNDFGVKITAPTIQAILNERGLKTIEDRMKHLQAMWWKQGDPDTPVLSPEQEANLLEWWIREEEANRKRKELPIGKQPGERLIHGWFEIGHVLPGKVVNLVIDGFDGRAFCYLGDEHDDGVIDTLRTVIQAYSRDGYRIQRIYTDANIRFGWNSTNHMYSILLANYGIEQLAVRSRGYARKLQERLDQSWHAVKDGVLAHNAARYIESKTHIENIEDDIAAWLAVSRLSSS